MNTTFAKSETLLGVAFAPLDLVRQVGLVIGFSLLTAVSAQVVIPIGPVPITGQTFAVLLTGALLGSRLGALAMIAYLPATTGVRTSTVPGRSGSAISDWRLYWDQAAAT